MLCFVCNEALAWKSHQTTYFYQQHRNPSSNYTSIIQILTDNFVGFKKSFMDQQQNTISPRNRRTRAQIESLLAEFSKSNVTVKQFCQAHCISTGTFHKWQARDKIKVLPKAGNPGFASVVVGRRYSEINWVAQKGKLFLFAISIQPFFQGNWRKCPHSQQSSILRVIAIQVGRFFRLRHQAFSRLPGTPFANSITTPGFWWGCTHVTPLSLKM